MEQEYNATCIKILRPEEVKQFDWVLLSELAEQYKQPTEWLQRGFEASRRLNLDPREYFVPRYVLKDTVKPYPEFAEVFKEVIIEHRATKH
ncbi:conserved hypothetical protein [Vibrio crassostreae]|uniref:hypothetical protein n=1 Tax=Vibrio crassostreae TaxID=246167 RepID=UPI000F49CF9D|nr:hypothetical protein [Vibrio crassostreae]ROR07980.1 hypothetical protein EDB36_11659 [Vibrio crassostreae]CAK1907345.1 conserved hypothetical protein [Vibrio crassostreae]CAK2306046.1 conserved hypothetical protein [Vibrio crassostreae]CAK2322132.1 conserved hypothetical protein [Vibrio crassostreae]CAK3225850.1 conserved hypothetical protein [Vibrio crassostreae]